MTDDLKRIFLLSSFLFFVTFLFFSCATTQPDGRASEGTNGTEAVRDGETNGTNGDRAMTNGTTSVGRKEKYTGHEEMMWNTTPGESRLVFFAVSPRLLDREEEKQTALKNAAEQAAKYFSLIGEARFLKQQTAGGIGYLQDIQVGFDDSLVKPLTEKMEITADYRDNRNTYIRTELPLSEAEKLGYSPKKDRTGRPLWISTPPSIPGRLVGVGIAQRKWAFTDSIHAADEKALEELLKQVSTTIRMIHSRHTIDNVGTIHDTTSLETAKAELDGFYVLSRWREGNYFYTLAVAKKKSD